MKSLNKIIMMLSGLIFTGFLSCGYYHTADTVKIRGKIINPQTDEIYISRDIFMQDTDTLKLVGENQVKATVKAPTEGLYLFFVYPEFQTIYLKPGDSLAFHINVEEFDESLSFSGSLGTENNLLMDLFLKNEQESNYFYRHNFKFKPKDFLKKIDSFKQIKEELIRTKLEDTDVDTKFKAIATLTGLSMDYNLMEIYPLKNPAQPLPKKYFDFEQVFQKNLADPNVIYMYSFADALINRQIDKKMPVKNRYLKRAEQIQKYIYDDKFKDNLLTQYCIDYIKKNHIYKDDDEVILTYFQNIKNTTYKDYCIGLIRKNQHLNKGMSFPRLELFNRYGKTTDSDSIFTNKKVCISFWDLKQRKNFVSNLHKLKTYQKQFPGIQFVIFNINPKHTDQWLMVIPELSQFEFYQLKNIKKLTDIEPYHLSQVYLIDKGKIKGSMVNMYRPDFEAILKKFYQEK